ncbi:MAG: Rrf2 family transcriptional regulator [Oscillospiraceae bacterium]|nr:Rrf2 family transcriptional regulator [Oscillospiraceae bacterium]MBQ9209652.1 Rrf2 family transcriptional regulator [Oscillospiraceae bacterium]
MKISTKGRYALRFMVDLAMCPPGQKVSLKDIASRQEISIKYLEQIVSVLTKAGYVTSVRGNNGGYTLARPPKEYTVGMILRLTEGSLAPVSCLEGDVNTCPRAETCITLEVWEKLNDAISDVVDNITLADLAEKSEDSTDALMFCI